MTSYKLYDVLGIDKGANKDAIKKAYKKLAMQHHPDKGGDPDKFKDISNAYETLSDDARRNEYDQHGDEGPPQGIGGGGGFPEDLFAQMFGGHHGAASRNNRRSDAHHNIVITLHDVYHGLNKSLKVSLQNICDKCKQTCFTCQGRGNITDMRRMGFMTQVMTRACHACSGTGTMCGNSGCSSCSGSGRVIVEKTIDLNIPPGVEHGSQFVFKGMGEQPIQEGDVAGNLVISIIVNNDKSFERRGKDLVFRSKLTFLESVIGKTLIVPHFGGNLEIKTGDFGIIEPRQEYLVPGKGLPGGGLLLSFEIVYPVKKFTEEEKKQLAAIFAQ